MLIYKHPQLPHSYYFTTRILVLKFANKGVFFEEIQDSNFPRKRGYFGTHLCEFGGQWVKFDVQCFTVKKRFHLGWKVSVLSWKRESFWAEKSVFCSKKGSHFQTGEQGWIPLFPVSEGAGQVSMIMVSGYSCSFWPTGPVMITRPLQFLPMHS